jgi:hypothetical protein
MSEMAERHVGTLMEYCKDLFRFGRGLEAFRPLADELLKYMNESHAQRTQLTLAQEMARENERLKQRVKELEELQLLDVHAICDQRDGYRAECDKLRRALRYLFYTRLPLGEKLEEFLAQDQPDKWQEIFALLADKSAMQNKNDGGMKILSECPNCEAMEKAFAKRCETEIQLVREVESSFKAELSGCRSELADYGKTVAGLRSELEACKASHTEELRQIARGGDLLLNDNKHLRAENAELRKALEGVGNLVAQGRIEQAMELSKAAMQTEKEKQ